MTGRSHKKLLLSVYRLRFAAIREKQESSKTVQDIISAKDSTITVEKKGRIYFCPIRDQT
jgi:hypothetical protein